MLLFKLPERLKGSSEMFRKCLEYVNECRWGQVVHGVSFSDYQVCVFYMYCTLPVYLLITYIYALLAYGKLCNTQNTSHSFERMHIYDHTCSLYT